MIGYIYCTTCLLDGRKYIGRKTSPIFLGHDYLGSGLHLKNAVAAYGAENFSVELIEWCETPKQLIEREAYWIAKYDAVKSDQYFNHSPGGYHEGFLPGELNVAKSDKARAINSQKHRGKKRSAEFVERQRLAHLGKPSGMLGKHHTEDFKRAQSERTHNQNLNRDPSTYQKMGQAKLGNKMMNKDGECVRVHPENFDEFLQSGWQFGGLSRKGKYINRKRNPNHKTNSGKVWIHQADSRLLVPQEELDKYLSDGWQLKMK